MTKEVKLKKGYDIRMEGSAERIVVGDVNSSFYGVKPIDFPGLTPKMMVRAGDSVKAGSPLFCDKSLPEVVFSSPVSGKVISVERGDRRKILQVVIGLEGKESVDFGKSDINGMSRDQIIAKLLVSGLWPMIRQRPYHVVARPSDIPKSVFISGFDSSPLAGDTDFIMENLSGSMFRKGLSVIKKLTTGKINLVLRGDKAYSSVLSVAEGVERSSFIGPHPSGNVGVHIHYLDPINKGDVVWFVNPQDVVAIGRLFEEGVYFPERIVALTGPEVVRTGYYRTLAGVSIESMVDSNTKTDNVRFISGNVLTGKKVDKKGYLGFYDSQISVIPEGNYFELFGWAKPGLKKYSFSRAFLSALRPKSMSRIDTNYHGGERPFVVTGQYEKVVPMDIYPMQLFKAILAGDIDLMEQLGIYEVAGEDFALCEFICSSKIEIQALIDDGIELMIREMR